MVQEPSVILRMSRILIITYTMYLLTWYFEVPERIWCLISIWFVMLDYHTVGGVLKKGLYRLMGTFISGIYGLLIILISHNNVILKMLAMIPLIFWYAINYLDTGKSYILSIGAVTLTIALLNDNNLSVTILRIFNVILGNIASIVMILFFFPVYASDEVNQSSAKLTQILLQICQFLQKDDANLDEFFELENHLRHDVHQMELLINEAEHEHFFTVVDYSVYKELIKLSHHMVYHFHHLLTSKKNKSDLKKIERHLEELHQGFERGMIKKKLTYDESSVLHTQLRNYEDCIEKILLRKNQ
jgi:uncharacterized membrane protein YccC